ncbi:ribbon-helix-helix domain-containing protein [Arthrobacter sp. RIT-PI-e]|uniref:ribbon-helix-helix domain-containing protein n=1 Tax=Arthrobacter sp. RIT-PI-e TaxID=1681197 RepID=UPI0009E462E2|nr:ribbon-helix-helix domain-containing protein [Arthrobacter sp. RIT-PI-e]
MTKKVETIGGVPVTEEMIQTWADEAEAGYTPDQLHIPKRGRPLMGTVPATQISVRLEKELMDLVSRNAAQRHVSKSDVVREAVRQYLQAS